jgi:beta-lactamase superfamily II metal-dependent hydrolase
MILESKLDKESTTILIDGGPYQTFPKHLKPTLKRLFLYKKLDLMVLSHIDGDHVIGLLDLLQEIKIQREHKAKEIVKISKMWHNSYKNLLLLPEEPAKLIANLLRQQISTERDSTLGSIIMTSFQQGTDLAQLANFLKIPINQGFGEVIQVVDKVKTTRLNNFSLHIIGPTKKNLDKLRKEWYKEFTKQKKTKKIQSRLIQILDKSASNLASIMFLVETENKKILFTGDGLGKDIVEVFSRNHMLDAGGKFYVDILKVPHHGSDRNTSPEFFNTVNAEYYVISANGMYDNPSLNTLKWIIESENASNRVRKIVLTNTTPDVKNLLQNYDQNKFNYKTIVMKPNSHFLTITM